MNDSDPTAITPAVHDIADCAHIPLSIADQVVAHYGVTWERKDGLRRLVLCGDWTVDPLALNGHA
jgi:hypothetical protein